MRKPSVSLCMIVRNEEKYLYNCLSSVDGLVEEIIIIDTGSTDNTINISKEFGARVYPFTWVNDFSAARNYSLSFATKEWILVLDADECLIPEEKEKFIDALRKKDVAGYFLKQISYTGTLDSSQTVTNLNHRLFRNNIGAQYTGKIHEQLELQVEQSLMKNYEFSDISFLHYGYLEEVLNEKNKTDRNITLLLEILESDPDNSFHLFNLGTEYMALNEHEKAFDCYDRAYKTVQYNVGYGPKLILYRINCLIGSNKIDEALIAIAEGLVIYPEYTDLVYLRGEIEFIKGQYTKAIRSFQKCLSMGKPPINIEYSSFVWSTGPSLKIAQAFEILDDLEMAFYYYQEYFKFPGSNYHILYGMMKCLKKLQLKEQEMIDILSKYLDLNEKNSYILFLDILMKEGFHSYVQTILTEDNDYHSDIQVKYIKASNAFYLKQYETSYWLWLNYLEEEKSAGALLFLFLIELINPSLFCPWTKETENGFYYKITKIIQNKDGQANVSLNNEEDLNLLIKVLENLLKVNEYKWFEQILDALNYFDSEDVLLSLAKLYDQFGFHDMAKKEIFRSIKYFDKIDRESVKLLLKYIR